MLPPGATQGLGALGQERGHDVPVPGAHGQLLEGEGSLGSSFLVAQAPDAVGLISGPRAVEPRRLLREEVAEAPPDPRLLRRMEGEVARERA